jgi:hypothetical protein
MTMLIVLRRLRETRLVSALLLAILCLVTAFLALVPQYTLAVVSAEFALRLEALSDRDRLADFTVTAPFDAGVPAQISAALAGYVDDQRSFQRAEGVACQLGIPDAPLPVYRSCGRALAYDEIDAWFTLIDGRWPGISDAVIEAVIVRDVTEKSARLAPDFNAGIGARWLMPPLNATQVTREDFLTFEIVGIVEANFASDDPRWNGQPDLFGLVDTSDPAAPPQLDFGLIVAPEVFEAQIVPALNTVLYTERVRLDANAVSIDRLDDLDARFEALQAALRTRYPNVAIFAAVNDWIAAFDASVNAVQPPVLFVAVLILCLLLYSVLMTATLSLERQHSEWSAMAARGGSTRQLLSLHAAGGALLVAVAIVIGPPLAALLLRLLDAFGPQAGALAVDTVGLPPSTWALSALAGLLALIAYALPGLPLARGSFTRLKGAARPSARPAWLRYGLDLLLLALGAGLLGRLYAIGDVAVSDPLSLAGPALLLVGLVLLWLRAFPLLVRAAGWLLGRSGAFTVTLAFWNVERDPMYYAQFVLMLIGTLALGTASLTLNATHEAGARSGAVAQIGADARVDVSPQTGAAVDWELLPGVIGAQPLMRVTTSAGVTLFGVDDAAFPGAFSGEVPIAGLPLPDDAAALSVSVFGEFSDPKTTLAVSAEILNADGVPVVVTLRTERDPSEAEVWYRFSAALMPEAVGRRPWTLAGLRFPARRADVRSSFNHALYLDRLTVTGADGVEQVLDEFEGETISAWNVPQNSVPSRGAVLLLQPEPELRLSGEGSLRLLYNVVVNSQQFPLLETRPAEVTLEALISPAFAREYGAATTLRRPIQVGDRVNSAVGILHGTDDRAALSLSYTVVGLVEQFAALDADRLFMILPREALQRLLNAGRTPVDFLGVNQVLLTLADTEPAPDVREVLESQAGVSRVTYAWDQYRQDRLAPLPNALTGVLYAGFWLSLALIVIGFGFYLVTLLRRRALSFAVLRAIGWQHAHLWRMLAVEQVVLIVPALAVGVGLGVALAAAVRPFLGLADSDMLAFPLLDLLGLVAVLGGLFALLLIAAARRQRRGDDLAALRQGE